MQEDLLALDDEIWNRINTMQTSIDRIQSNIDANQSTDTLTETATETSTQISRWIYVVAAILWLVIILVLDLELGPVSLIILAIPFIVFAINWYLVPKEETPDFAPVCNSDLIAFAVLITAIMLNWNSSIITDKSKFFKPIVAAFILMMLSLVDFWLDVRYARILKYTTGALQTMAVALITYSLYSYYETSTSL